MKHGVLVLPTLVLFKGGEADGKRQGGVPPTAIARRLTEHRGEEDEDGAEAAEA